MYAETKRAQAKSTKRNERHAAIYVFSLNFKIFNNFKE